MEQVTIKNQAIQDYIQAQQWRYATKKFDTTKKLSSEQLEQLMLATQLSASSYGLQAYKILVVEDPAIRAKLREASWGQAQLTDASQVFVFCIPTSVGTKDIAEYMTNIANTRGIPVEALQGFSDYINGAIGNMSAEQHAIWMAKQTYIALGSLLSAAAVMQVDACPMEGFDPSQYDKILGLEAKGLKSVVVAAVGFRSSEDANATNKKVRKPLAQLFEKI